MGRLLLFAAAVSRISFPEIPLSWPGSPFCGGHNAPCQIRKSESTLMGQALPA